jgi:aspartyl aminopeptidase
MTKEQKDKLLYRPKNGCDVLTEEDERAMNAYCERYKKFLDESKTERECVVSAIRLARARGFSEYVPGMALKPGDKIYCDNRGKGMHAGRDRRKAAERGRADHRRPHRRPRLDLKPNPLYEDASWPISRRTTTAASASTSGPRCRWSCTAWWR